MALAQADKDREIAAIKAMFDEQQELFRTEAGKPKSKKGEIESSFSTHLTTYFAKDVMVLHAHHSSSPLTKRKRPNKHMLLGVTNLLSWAVDCSLIADRLTHQYATIVWADIKEDSCTNELVATVGIALEGLVQVKADEDTKDENYDPYYGHLGIWIMRKPNDPKEKWTVHSVANGYPLDQIRVGGSKYKRKLSNKSKIGKKNKPLKYFRKLQRKYHRKDAKKFKAKWKKAIPWDPPPPPVVCQDWSAQQHAGMTAWDLLGWDISISGRGC